MKVMVNNMKQIEIKTNHETLKRIENNCFKVGLCGGVCSTSDIQTDTYLLFKNHNIVITFTRKRNEHGIWCDTQKIKFTNYDNNTEYYFIQ